MPRFGVLGTFPPAYCGLASFTASLTAGLEANVADVGVVRVADGTPSSDPRVIGELTNGSPHSIAACANLLSQFDVAVIQHDFDVYGGEDGGELVALMRALSVPSIVVVHTVPSHPTAQQRSVLEAVIALADQVVVPSDAANQRLRAGFLIDRDKVSTIAQGTSIPKAVSTKRAGRPTLLTWGLLGPGKGVERVIDAMGSLHELRGQPRYLVAGPTHPKVLAAEGEAYREARIQQARSNGVAGSVSLDAAYRHPTALAAMVQSCAVVVVPYDSTDQVNSSVLVDAVASGRPVVATAFPHAVEMLGSGAGVIVNHDDPEAMVLALRRILSDPRVAGTMAAEGRRLAPSLVWSTVAKSYVTLGQRVVRDRRVRA